MDKHSKSVHLLNAESFTRSGVMQPCFLPHRLSVPVSHMAVISTMEILARDETPHHSNTGTHVGHCSQQDAAPRTYCAKTYCKKKKKAKHRNLINQENNPDAPPTHLTLNRHCIVPRTFLTVDTSALNNKLALLVCGALQKALGIVSKGIFFGESIIFTPRHHVKMKRKTDRMNGSYIK